MHNLKFALSAIVLLALQALAQSKPLATLTSSNPAFGAELGLSVAMTGSTVTAGGAAVVNGQLQGVVYVFTKPATAQWTSMTESAQLRVPGVALGSSVAVSGDANTIVAIGHSAVYVFVKPTNGWQGIIGPVAVLGPGPPPKPWVIQGDLSAVAINAKGDTIVGGALNSGTQGHSSGGKSVAGVLEQGAAYVWAEPTDGWSSAIPSAAKLTAADGVAFDHFGYAVGISANTVVAGAPGVANGSAANEGAAYLFARPSTGIWHNSSKSQSKFTASDAEISDNFGTAVAVGNSGALVAVGSGRGCGVAAGTAYVFARPSSWWPAGMTQTAELTPSDSSGSCFGYAITVGNQLVLVGAPSASSGAGASYTFAKPSSGWTNLSLTVSMVGDSESVGFGRSESVNGPTTAIGAPFTPVNGNNGAGAVYLFGN